MTSRAYTILSKIDARTIPLQAVPKGINMVLIELFRNWIKKPSTIIGIALITLAVSVMSSLFFYVLGLNTYSLLCLIPAVLLIITVLLAFASWLIYAHGVQKDSENEYGY